MIRWPFTRSKDDENAGTLYEAIVAQARHPGFYADLGVADTVEGRFDMIVLHTFLLASRLKTEGEAGEKLSQMVLEALFDDMDASLREMGVGDLGVPKRIRKMAESCFGRMQAYDEAMQTGGSALEDSVARNVYSGQIAQPGAARAIANYMRRTAGELAGQAFDELNKGVVAFSSPLAEDNVS